MDLGTAFATCSGFPKFQCRVQTKTCYKYVICDKVGEEQEWIHLKLKLVSSQDNCREDHIYKAIVCCEYFC